MTIRVRGARELRSSMKRAGEDIATLKEAHAAVAAYVAAVAAARAPRRSGKLAASVRGNRAVSRARVSAGGARLPYAGPVHWGWQARGIESQPFITDAAQSTEIVWLAQYERAISAALEKVKGTT